MSLICKLLGHRPLTKAGWTPGSAGYARVQRTSVDGLGAWHLYLTAECPRCGERYEICNVHVPSNSPPAWDGAKTNDAAPAIQQPQAAEQNLGADDRVDAERYRHLRELMQFSTPPNKPTTMKLRAPIPAPEHNPHRDWVGDQFDASVDRAVDASLRACLTAAEIVDFDTARAALVKKGST